MKATLKNTTVKFNNKRNSFMVFKGKGTGRQIAGFPTMEEAVLFDENLFNLEGKHIERLSNNDKGFAYFFKGTSIMFDKNHPFFNDFKLA